jgi:hypothetical protein
MLDYLTLLETGYKQPSQDGYSRSRLEFISEYIFDFTTYDSEMSELFSDKALEVCEALTNKTVADYINNSDNYKWYLLLCNIPFFADRIDWGTSVRGAWWQYNSIELSPSALWMDENTPINKMVFTHEEWVSFINALITFGRTK